MGLRSSAVLLVFTSLSAGCGPHPGYIVEEPVGYTRSDVPVAVASPRTELTVELFYEALSPFGQWVDHAELGAVWVPDDAGYVPYTRGHWEHTEDGFTWRSDEPFGWAVCHYGRWVLLDRWVWVPGTEWAPAWVVWREGTEVAGWAPMPPEGWGQPVPRTAFVFVHVSHLFVTEVHEHYYAGWEAHDAYAATAWIDTRSRLPGGGAYCPGPSPDRLRRAGVPVRVSRAGGRRGRVIVRTARERPRVEVRRPTRRRHSVEVRGSSREPGEAIVIPRAGAQAPTRIARPAAMAAAPPSGVTLEPARPRATIDPRPEAVAEARQPVPSRTEHAAALDARADRAMHARQRHAAIQAQRQAAIQAQRQAAIQAQRQATIQAQQQAAARAQHQAAARAQHQAAMQARHRNAVQAERQRAVQPRPRPAAQPQPRTTIRGSSPSGVAPPQHRATRARPRGAAQARPNRPRPATVQRRGRPPVRRGR